MKLFKVSWRGASGERLIQAPSMMEAKRLFWEVERKETGYPVVFSPGYIKAANAA